MHRFTPTELRYPAYENELSAVCWGVKKCRHYLYGRQFTVQTYYQSSALLTKSFQDVDNQRVVPRLERLLQYDFAVKCINGITNVVADALSRRPNGQPLCNATALICDALRFLSKWRSSYVLDTHAAAVRAKLNNGRRMKHYTLDDGLLWFATLRGLRRVYVLASLCTDILRKSHDHEPSGHGGASNTVESFSRWPKRLPAAEEYALSCQDCQQLNPEML